MNELCSLVFCSFCTLRLLSPRSEGSMCTGKMLILSLVLISQTLNEHLNMTLIHKLTSTHEISESEKSKCPIKLSPIFAEFFARVKIPIFSPFLFFI